MAYPLEPRWIINLYYNTTHTLDTGNVYPLYVQAAHPEPKKEGENKKFLGGYTKTSTQMRMGYEIPLEPHRFPDDMTDYNELFSIINSNNYFWIESDTYPYTIDVVEVALNWSVKHMDDSAEKQVTLSAVKSTVGV